MNLKEYKIQRNKPLTVPLESSNRVLKHYTLIEGVTLRSVDKDRTIYRRFMQ